LRIVLGDVHENTDPPYPVGLLRPRDERPSRHRTCYSIDEIAPSHCLHPRLRTTPTLLDYIRDLRSTKWGPTINLRCKNPD
jgi:hypothetical protein